MCSDLALRRLQIRIIPSINSCAGFSTLASRNAKARPVSRLKVAETALRRLFNPRGKKLDYPKPFSVVHGLHGTVNGHDAFATLASETSKNVISAELAEKYHLRIQPTKATNKYVLPNGETAKPIGITKGEWTFRGESASKTLLDFLVLKSPSRPLILGNDLLDESNTLDINWHRVRTISIEPEDYSCVNMLGEAQDSVAGRLNGTPIYAVAATGCEVNLVSEDFVDEHCSKHDLRRPTEPHSLKLIDGTFLPIKKTVVLTWQYGDERDRWRAEFVVVDDLPYDVVLGQEFLYGSGVYFRYADCFRDQRPTCMRTGISFKPSLLMLAFAPKPNLGGNNDADIMEEAIRRETNDHYISRLSPSYQHSAMKLEHERREAWNNGYRDDAHSFNDHGGPRPVGPVTASTVHLSTFSMTTKKTQSAPLSDAASDDSDSDVSHDSGS